jgi:putative ABC transport system permease protein
MRRVVLGELLHRRGRTIGLLLGILVASTSFTVLTGTSDSQRLEVRGSVAKAFRGDYDVLVRPRGSRGAFERRTGQVQPNFLSGLFGGITTAQWRRIQRMPGVQVAAPIANLGYVLPTARVGVPLRVPGAGRRRVLLRADVSWRSDAGRTRVPDAPSFVYVTPNALQRAPGDHEPDAYRRYALQERVPGARRPAPVCYEGFDAVVLALGGPFAPDLRTELQCYSTAPSSPVAQSSPRVDVRWSFPLLISAIDPASEARLTGLDRAITRGRYLRSSDRTRLARANRRDAGYPPRILPVIAATRTFIDEQADVDVRTLSRAAITRWVRPFGARNYETLASLHFLRRQAPGRLDQRRRISAQAAYARLLAQLQRRDLQRMSTIWRVKPTRSAVQRTAMRPQARAAADTVWENNVSGAGLDWTFAPPSARDTWFRDVQGHRAHVTPATPPAQAEPVLASVGRFDVDRLRDAAGPVGAPPLTTQRAPVLRARSARAAARLGERQLKPNANLGGYLAQPPALLTTLRAAQALGGELFPQLRADRPISAVRVRVAGVTGPDPVSRERIRLAAERIATRTGLDVDITAGASGAPTAVDLPAGRFGRPPLELSELWIRKGVATRILAAIDRKSVVLFMLILVVCALFVANATSAAVRARRSELGVLACLGWTTGRLFAVVLAEVAVIGLAAGLLGAVLALPLATLVGVDASPARATLTVPAAVALAVLAGLVPAVRAARADPIAAVRPAVLEAGRARRPRTLAALAAINLLRTPGRTALGALSLAIGVCALTLLLAATLAFHDTLVGTLLGDATAIEVRASDYVAVIATIVLGIAAVADVLFLSLRERAPEFATLAATGWDDRALGRLLTFEGLWIGAMGASVGALIGLTASAIFAGALPTTLLLTTLAATLTGTALAGLAGLAPAVWLRRAPSVAALAGE